MREGSLPLPQGLRLSPVAEGGGTEQEREGAEDKPTVKYICPALQLVPSSCAHAHEPLHFGKFYRSVRRSEQEQPSFAVLWAHMTPKKTFQPAPSQLHPWQKSISGYAIQFPCHCYTAGSPPFQEHTASCRLLAVPSVTHDLLQMQIAVFTSPTPKYLDLCLAIACETVQNSHPPGWGVG